MSQPTRTCIGCRRRAPRAELVRIVAARDGYVHLDLGGRAPGRGAYVCSNVGCLEEAVRRKRIAPALRTTAEKVRPELLMPELLTIEESGTWRS